MKKSLKGVNLGGWLVLERWITPSLFKGVKSRDELGLCEELGPKKAQQIITTHRRSFITENDFKWLSANGIEILRIPLGYWIFGNEKTYVGGLHYLDFAFDQAEKHGMKILICMHGAAGSQNGEHHSGKSGQIQWHTDENQTKTLSCLKKLATRYKDRQELWGIELLNEPDRNIDKKSLTKFYRDCYREIRSIVGEKIYIVISDQFRPFRWVLGLGRNYKNLILDRHLYQIFSPLDKKTSYKAKIFIVKTWWYLLIWVTQLFTPTIVGEWSAAMPKTAEPKNATYMKAQDRVFSSSRANFYWTYKTEDEGNWNYRSRKEYFLKSTS